MTRYALPLALWIGLGTTCCSPAPADPPSSSQWQTLHGPMRAVAWTPVPPDCVNITGMIWVRTSVTSKTPTDPVEAAKESRQKPPGMAAVFLWDMTRDLLEDPEDACRTADGQLTHFPSPWPEHAIARIKARAMNFFTAYKAAGGRLDFLVLDYEGGLSNWALKPDNIRAIQADPRSGPLKQELGFDDFEKVVNWAQFRPEYKLGVDDLAAVVREKSPPYLRWNAVMGKLVVNALNQALFDPVRALYPNVKASNYGASELTPENIVPDFNGHLQYSLGHCGTHGTRAFYGSMGQFALRKLPDGTPYGRSPFAVLRYELNVMRGIRRSSNVPFEPWISHKNFSESVLRDNDYYQELIYHLALSGAQDFLYWNPGMWRKDQDPSQFRTDEHDRLVDHCISALNDRFGNAVRKCVTLAAIPWDQGILWTGMQIGNSKVVYRVTVPPGVTTVKVEPGGAVLDLHDEPGIWYETKPGVSVRFVPA